MHAIRDLERVGIFVDHAETRAALRQAGRQVAFPQLRSYLGEGRHVLTTFVYLAEPAPAADPVPALYQAEQLRQEGVVVRTVPGQLTAAGEATADVCVPLTLDILDFVQQARPDIIVLGHSGAGMVALLERLRLHGVRSELASTHAQADDAARRAADSLIDLAQVGHPVDHLPAYHADAVLPAPAAAKPQVVAPEPGFDDSAFLDLA